MKINKISNIAAQWDKTFRGTSLWARDSTNLVCWDESSFCNGDWDVRSLKRRAPHEELETCRKDGAEHCKTRKDARDI